MQGLGDQDLAVYVGNYKHLNLALLLPLDLSWGIQANHKATVQRISRCNEAWRAKMNENKHGDEGAWVHTHKACLQAEFETQ